jgi:hypothetical protein
MMRNALSVTQACSLQAARNVKLASGKWAVFAT